MIKTRMRSDLDKSLGEVETAALFALAKKKAEKSLISK